jgi:hypothetical protein
MDIEKAPRGEMAAMGLLLHPPHDIVALLR